MLHLLAIVFGIFGALAIGVTVMLYYGYTTPEAVDGITTTSGELYSFLLVVAAIGSEVAATHYA